MDANAIDDTEGDTQIVFVVPAEDTSKTLVSDEDVKFLTAEREVTNETEAQQAQRIFQSNGAIAAKSICNLARHSSSERIRLQAAQYVVERVIGRVQDNPPQLAADPYKELVDCVVRFVEENDDVPNNEG